MKRIFIYRNLEEAEASLHKAEKIYRRFYNVYGFHRVNSGKLADNRVFIVIDIPKLKTVWGDNIAAVYWFHNVDEMF